MNSARTIEVEGRSTIWSLLFLEDGMHFISGGNDGMIRKWSTIDFRQIGEPLQGERPVLALALSRNRKWIVSGENKLATVWERDAWKKVLQARDNSQLEAVDISPCSTKFVTGTTDCNAYVWDISTGHRLLGPLGHNGCLVAVKFSPDGGSIVTVSWEREIRIYGAENGQLIKTFPVKVRGTNAISWSSDTQRVFTISSNTIKHIYVDTGSFISQWSIPGQIDHEGRASLAVPVSGKFIVSYAGSSLSVWDPSTLRQFGPTFEHPGQRLKSIAISSDNNYLVTSGEKGIITLRNLNNIIPMSYLVQQLQNVNHIAHQTQTEAAETFRSLLRTLESRFGTVIYGKKLTGDLMDIGKKKSDELTGMLMPPNNASELRATLPLIPNGVYRIKSKISDVYLTCPQDSNETVVVQELDACNDSQEWSIVHDEDGAYRIMSKRANTLLSAGKGNELACDSCDCMWTIEPRGNAYVIGYIANATVIHLTRRPQHVWTQLRDNSQNQRWVLERVSSHNQVILEA